LVGAWPNTTAWAHNAPINRGTFFFIIFSFMGLEKQNNRELWAR
jgi:hypothetical protein